MRPLSTISRFHRENSKYLPEDVFQAINDYKKVNQACVLLILLCGILCSFSCAYKIPGKKGFQELRLYSYDKKSESLSLSSEDSESYLYYYLKDADVESGMLSNTGSTQSSLEVCFSPAPKDSNVIVAFLYQSDFVNGKLISALPERPLAKCLLPAGKSARVSLAFPNDRTKLKGFLVYSEDDVSITDVSKTTVDFGFTENENVVSWSFSPEGGDMETFADRIPPKPGFQSLKLFAYGKASESLSLYESESEQYLCYYTKENNFENSFSSQSGKNPQSLEVRFEPVEKDAEVMVGLLYENDFENDKLVENLPDRPLAKCTIPAGKSARVRLAFPVDGTKIKGFLVYSAGTVSVDDVSRADSVIGWSSTENEVAWSFGAEGGDSQSLFTYTGNDSLIADFGASLDFSAVLDNSVQEYVRIYYRDNKSDAGSNGKQGVVVFSAGENKFTVRRSPEPQKSEFYVPYLFVTSDASSGKNRRISVSSGAKMVTGIEYYFIPAVVAEPEDGQRMPSAIKSDLGCIPTWSSKLWNRKDFELFQWDLFPNILLFDFADYKIQDNYLKRLAFYVEKVGYRGSLWADKDIANLHGYNAHDYRAESLASFFNVAMDENFSLNESEYFLRDILVQYGIIKQYDDGSFVPGKGGIISISKESPVYLRTSLLAHESFHGIYFVEEAFRNKVSEVCTIMDQKSLNFLKSYFASQPTLGYDLNDTYLVENEIMAYIMQQSVNAQSSYFADNIAWRGSVMNALPDLASYIRSTKASGLTAAAAMLDEYVFSRWGLNAGRTSMVSVSQK
ncbi:MAG: hypothetical protein K5751_13055 [Treponemataceae bacterium]|nr:hypothetical protein [Treponemataceae bacterium]